MNQPDSFLLEAIGKAMDVEQKASRFYREGAARAGSPRGRDLLNQLADFEQSHYDKLAELRASLASGEGFGAYKGTTLRVARPEAEGGQAAESRLDDVLDILRAAIAAESEAQRRYQELAAQCGDAKGRKLFDRLAQEELLHRRILADEYFSLSNRDGIWAWGE
ncbi:MAG: ferritin family protein [Planctomycetes bacterium]|nr:ferritin family protein [Planctomycetota bacterium]